jgi:hypothetical protein
VGCYRLLRRSFKWILKTRPNQWRKRSGLGKFSA